MVCVGKATEMFIQNLQKLFTSLEPLQLSIRSILKTTLSVEIFRTVMYTICISIIFISCILYSTYSCIILSIQVSYVENQPFGFAPKCNDLFERPGTSNQQQTCATTPPSTAVSIRLFLKINLS